MLVWFSYECFRNERAVWEWNAISLQAHNTTAAELGSEGNLLTDAGDGEKAVSLSSSAAKATTFSWVILQAAFFLTSQWCRIRWKLHLATRTKMALQLKYRKAILNDQLKTGWREALKRSIQRSHIENGEWKHKRAGQAFVIMQQLNFQRDIWEVWGTPTWAPQHRAP